MIESLHARQIFDSRGKPTLEVSITANGITSTASVPSGASTGKYEAHELRDGVQSDFLGLGVSCAIRNVNSIIAPALVGKYKVIQQQEIDKLMIEKLDGTPNKQKLGANAILAVSLAVARSAALNQNIPLYEWIAKLAGNSECTLPLPAFNVINGGRHSGNPIAIQEFMLLPTGAGTFEEAMKMGVECYHNLRALIQSKYGPDSVSVGDEGGFAPNISTTEECLSLLVDAIQQAGYQGRVKIGLDCAASEFHSNGKYDLSFKQKGHNPLTRRELREFYSELVRNWPIISIEDPFDEDDFEAWREFHETMGKSVQIIADDLTVTNPKRIELAAKSNCCNCLLLKPNQIGTLTEVIDAVRLARSYGWNVMTSHRSGETEDSFIADLAVGLNTQQIKAGAPCRSERLVKYNRLLGIEEESKGSLKFKHPFQSSKPISC